MLEKIHVIRIIREQEVVVAIPADDDRSEVAIGRVRELLDNGLLDDEYIDEAGLRLEDISPVLTKDEKRERIDRCFKGGGTRILDSDRYRRILEKREKTG